MGFTAYMHENVHVSAKTHSRFYISLLPSTETIHDTGFLRGSSVLCDGLTP